MTTSSLPDWITAISTLATALATGVAGVIAWRAFVRDFVRSLPIVETDVKWVEIKSTQCLELTVTIRNQLYETIVFDSVRVDRPRHSAFGLAKLGQQGEPIEITRSKSRLFAVNQAVRPAVTSITFFDRPQRLDVSTKKFYLFPPDDWGGGLLKLTVSLSSKALTIRDKRITIKRRISPRPAKQTDENASR